MKNLTSSQNRYRIGIDVGNNSVGFSAIEYDQGGTPIKVLASVSHIHDGGKDPSSGKSPASRIAVSGFARRARRGLRNKRHRLQNLDKVLIESGFVVPDGEIAQTNEAWVARGKLVEEYISNESERNELIVLAVRHIARHRGWRNPWWSFKQLENAPTPSENLIQIIDNAINKLGLPEDERPATQGQVGMIAVRPGTKFRPKKTIATGQKVTPDGELLFTQTRQEDILRELRLIFDTQKVNRDIALRIEMSVFKQQKPRIRSELVGFDELPGMGHLHRAPIACLEFQEHRIRAAVANLRFRSSAGASGISQRLPIEQQNQIIEMLLTNRDKERPSWRDIEEFVGLTPKSLVSENQDSLSFPPVDDTSRKIEQTFDKKNALGIWWREASQEDRGKLIWYLVENTLDLEELERDDILEMLATLDDKTLVKLQGIELRSGRASYSRESLVKLNERMKNEHLDLHDARKAEFQIPDNWKPPRDSLNDPIEHPTVQRVNSIVRKLILASYREWGIPERVVIEHVRSALFGPAAKAEYDKEMSARQKTRSEMRNQLVNAGIPDPKEADIRRNECVQRQNSVCLYCGSTIGLTTSELDHIIPQSMGGSTRQENIVAVCRQCNSAKGKLPFAQFADASTRAGVSLADAFERLENWNKGLQTSKSFTRLKRDVKDRLQQTKAEPTEDDRSLESTAYSARLIRDRVESTLLSLAEKDKVKPPEIFVFRGEINSEARKAGGIDKKLRLRGNDVKSRFDRRHHAVDAAVITTLSNKVAETLAVRRKLQYLNRFTGKEENWKNYVGSDIVSRTLFSKWQEAIDGLGNLLTSAVEKDIIRVARPIRLNPRVGRVHKDTVEKLEHKKADLPFSPTEIARIADIRIYEAIMKIADPKAGLAACKHPRVIAGTELDSIDLFPSGAAYLKVRNGASAIGDTVHHARIYAWENNNNSYSIGMIRVFAGEFSQIGFLKSGIDILRSPLPAHSISLRTADPSLLKKIKEKRARYIGYLAINDEIEIDPNLMIAQLGDTKLRKFLEVMPESRWIISGFFDPTKVSIVPSILANEGVDENTSEIISSVLNANRIPMSVNVVMGSHGCRVIRRTILGRPRWNSKSMPSSWIPQDEAQAAFK